jgi:predicted transglutaminase-like cysteine proteinase
MLDLLNKEEHVAHLNETWKYVYDSERHGFDRWVILKEPPYEGDCEDYAITLLWLMSGKSMINFWINVITMQVQLRRVITKKGEGHVVLRIGNLYIDNWSKAFVPWETMERAGHKKFLWMYDPLLVIWKMSKSSSTLKKSSRGG